MRNWRIEPLERLAEIRPSNVDKKSISGEQPVRLCNYMDVYSRSYITADLEFMEATATATESQRFGIQCGDVIITKDSETPDDIGIPAVVVDEIANLVCGYHLALIKPKRELIDPVYLAKQLSSIATARHFGRLANGSTRYGLSYRSIAQTPVQLPPLSQQQRIAEVLSTVDAAIAETETLIAKTQQIKAGLIHDLFNRGVTADGRIRPSREEAPQLYKKWPLGWIPRDWDSCEFGNVLIGTPQNGLYKPMSAYGDAGNPIVRIDSFYDGALIELGALRRLRLSPLELKTYGLTVGDILINRVNSIDYVGKSALVPQLHEPVVFESNVMRCRVNRDVLTPEFLIRWLCGCKALGHFRSRAKSAIAQASINQRDVSCLPVPVPSADEQRRISARTDAIDDAMAVERANLTKLFQIKQGLMMDLLTGHVPVSATLPQEDTRIAASV